MGDNNDNNNISSGDSSKAQQLVITNGKQAIEFLKLIFVLNVVIALAIGYFFARFEAKLQATDGIQYKQGQQEEKIKQLQQALIGNCINKEITCKKKKVGE